MEKKSDIVVYYCVGVRETLRAAEDGSLSGIVLAKDTDRAFRARVEEAAHKYGAPLVYANSALELGRRVGIEVKAGVVGILKKDIISP